LRLQCQSVQSECLQQAEIHCADQGGVHVVSSREKNELYGVEGNKEGMLVSEVVFVCGNDAPRDPIKLPPKDDESKPQPPPEPPTKRVCIPGSTQQCIGPGACVGGQSCLPGGQGWAPCECSSAPAPQPDDTAESQDADAGNNADEPKGDPADSGSEVGASENESEAPATGNPGDPSVTAPETSANPGPQSPR
jgi:hypothetical protein